MPQHFSVSQKLAEAVTTHEKRLQRILEILPGFSVWMILIFPFWASLIWPTFVAYLVIAFMVFWLYRSLTLSTLSVRGYQLIKRSLATDWKQKYHDEKQSHDLSWDDVLNVIIVPITKEPQEVIERSIGALAAQEEAKKHLIVVLAMEDRFEHNRANGEALVKKFGKHFKEMHTVFHPPGLPGEVVGKASNERWATIAMKKLLVDERGIDINTITLTSCDCDAMFHPKYFSNLTYSFLTSPHRYLRFWQSIIFEHNNIEQVPGLIRIVSILGGSFHIFDTLEPRRLFINYSSYSTSLTLLHKVGYWDPDIIPEDWHIFLKSFFSLKGEVEVEPIFLPTTIDAPQSPTYLGSLVNRYEQCRRHAWGVTLVPYVVLQFFKHPEIPTGIRLLRVFKVVESQILWSTSWFFVTLSATIPPLINPAFEQTVLGHNLPRIAGNILTVSLIGLIITVVIDMKLRPPAKLAQTAWWKRPFLYVEWVFLPLATLFMAALPGLHAQTNLMLGKYMEYKVTEKV